MKRIVSLVVYVLCVLISRHFCAGYWVVGPVFGAAVLVTNYESVFKKPSYKHPLFIIASTLIYALVYRISARGWKIEKEWLDMLAGSTTGGIVAGSILMPLVHAKLFSLSFRNAISVSLALIISWYAVVSASFILEAMGLKAAIDYILIAIVFWQAIYLKHLEL